MRRNKGFSLVSLVIALGLVSIAGVLAIQYQLRQSRARLAQTWIEAQAREMDQIVGAVRTWTNTPGNTASWANDVRTGISCQSLITSGLLPSGFGRDGAICKSPFGTIYAISAIKNFADPSVPQGRVRAIVYTPGAPDPHATGLLRRAGIPNTATGIQGVAMRIAGSLAERKVPAGWLFSGSTTATGVGRAWSKILSSWLPAAPAQATAVAFIGFPDLDGSYAVPNGLPPFTSCHIVADICPQSYDWGGCRLGYAPTTTFCPPGEVQVKVFDACAPAQLEFVRGINATLTGGGADIRSTPGRSAADCGQFGIAACVGNPDPNCAAAKAEECNRTPSMDTTIVTTVSLNNERQLSTACGYSDDTWTGQGASAGLINITNGAQPKNARVCCVPF